MKAQRPAVSELLKAADPLSEDGCTALIGYAEEDQHVDFKESFDPSNDKCWIDLSTDCVAFANTEGGFIVFGVVDKTWKEVGIDGTAAAALADVKKVLEQVNKCLAPHLTAVRTRIINKDSKTFAVVFVPPSLNATHIYESNRDLVAGGKSTPKVPKGAVYVRRVGSNQVLTAVDFELLVDRRINRFREKILEGLTRVVKADPTADLITVRVAPTEGGARNVTIVDAPSELAISGKTANIALNTIEDRISAYMALGEKGRDAIPPEVFSFEVYVERGSVTDKSRIKWMAGVALVTGAPAFYWLTQLEKDEARKVVDAAFGLAPNWRRETIRDVAGFFGKPLYDKLNGQVERPNRKPFRDREEIFGVKRSEAPDTDAAAATVGFPRFS